MTKHMTAKKKGPGGAEGQCSWSRRGRWSKGEAHEGLLVKGSGLGVADDQKE